MRDLDHSRDLVYWVRIWEPGDINASGYSQEKSGDIIRHQVNLFTTPARLNCEKSVLAVFPNLLSDPLKILELKTNAKSYHDNFGSPVAVAMHILKTAGNIISAKGIEHYQAVGLDPGADGYSTNRGL